MRGDFGFPVPRVRRGRGRRRVCREWRHSGVYAINWGGGDMSHKTGAY